MFRSRNDGARTVHVHIGAPKTGTSTLQTWLAANRRRFNAAGVEILTPARLRKSPVMRAFMPYYRGRADDLDEAALRAALAPGSKLAGRGMRAVALSEETFAHDLMPSRTLAHGGFDRVERTAEFVARLPFERRRIILTVRRQDEMLTSTYTHFVHRHREARSFRDWLEAEVDMDRLSWRRVFEELAAAVGPENVVLAPFDAVRSEGLRGVYARLVRAMELDPAGHETRDDEVSNPSPSDKGVRLIRYVNGAVGNRRKATRIGDFLMGEFPIAEHGGFRPGDDRFRETLADLYAAENRALAETHFPEFADVFAFGAKGRGRKGG